MTEIQDANDALALLGVKLSPLAELYSDLHKAYTELLAEHADLLRRFADAKAEADAWWQEARDWRLMYDDRSEQ